jgi:hypothetical protein
MKHEKHCYLFAGRKTLLFEGTALDYFIRMSSIEKAIATIL